MSALKRNWSWLAAVLIVAAVVHLGSVMYLPHLIMGRTMAGIARTGGGVNRIFHAGRPNAASRGVVRPSPDLLYSTCVYDVAAAGGAVHVHAKGMPRTYWSVSVFDADTDNFYVADDAKAGGDGVDFLIIAADTAASGSNLPVVVTPTNRGIVLFRTLINDETQLPGIDRARRGAACEAFTETSP